MTCRELYLLARRRLGGAGVDSPGADAAALAQRFLGLDRAGLALHGEETPPPQREAAFLQAVEERAARRPLQYILGEWEFMGLPLAVGEGVLCPREDTAVLVEELARRGYGQYEISNFARPGRESRHNLLYWRGEEYLGFGPGAHSFFGGRRFCYPRDLEGFLQGNSPVDDGPGGDFGEFAMLNLRLTRGLRREDCLSRFGAEGGALFDEALENARHCPPQLLRADGEAISFTPEGFLVSNALLVKLLGEEL